MEHTGNRFLYNGVVNKNKLNLVCEVLYVRTVKKKNEVHINIVLIKCHHIFMIFNDLYAY